MSHIFATDQFHLDSSSMMIINNFEDLQYEPKNENNRIKLPLFSVSHTLYSQTREKLIQLKGKPQLVRPIFSTDFENRKKKTPNKEGNQTKRSAVRRYTRRYFFLFQFVFFLRAIPRTRYKVTSFIVEIVYRYRSSRYYQLVFLSFSLSRTYTKHSRAFFCRLIIQIQ